jgi:hypothetical protein
MVRTLRLHADRHRGHCRIPDHVAVPGMGMTTISSIACPACRQRRQHRRHRSPHRRTYRSTRRDQRGPRFPRRQRPRRELRSHRKLNGPKTCGLSPQPTPTSRASTHAATTRNPSTATSTTPSGSTVCPQPRPLPPNPQPPRLRAHGQRPRPPPPPTPPHRPRRLNTSRVLASSFDAPAHPPTHRNALHNETGATIHHHQGPNAPLREVFCQVVCDPRPRSSGDRASASGAVCAGSNPAEGAFRAT